MRFRSFDADSITRLPVAVDPVKVILSISGCAVSKGPSASPPVMMFSTPGGNTPATNSAKRNVASGVNGDGFNTMVQPDNKAGTIFWIAINTGKFHGTMPPTTPTGTRRVRLRRLSLSSVIFSSRFSIGNARVMPTQPAISLLACMCGLPCSAVNKRISSSLFALIASAIFANNARRSSTLVFFQVWNAARAAATALSKSA